MDFSSLLPMIEGAGLPALAVALVVLVLVYLADFTDLLPSGDAKRIAVAVLSFMFAGATGGGLESAVIGAIAAVGASLLKFGIDALHAKYVADNPTK